LLNEIADVEATMSGMGGRELTEAAQTIDELVQAIVGEIVDYPESISTLVVESGSTIVVELTVAREDIGKVIGRQGSMARSLRTILSNAATKLSRRSVLQIIE
jgi:predicted RNA-binding protein YlqC (UPF0109 family)